jgi:nitrate/nitrite transporter NarK
MGVGMAFIFPNQPKMVGEWFRPKEFGFANGIVVAGLGIGNALVMVLVGMWFLPVIGSWQDCFKMIGIIGLIFTVLWWIFAKERQAHHSPDSPHGVERIRFREGLSRVSGVKDMWLLMGIQFCVMGTFIGFIGFLPHMLEVLMIHHRPAHLSLFPHLIANPHLLRPAAVLVFLTRTIRAGIVSTCLLGLIRLNILTLNR